MAKDTFSTIILAAGKGTRMNSPLPKVVHPVAGRPMIERVVRAAKQAECKEVRVVVGFGENLVRSMVEPLGAICFKQDKQLGTADAVRSAQPGTMEGPVLILNGDHPLLTGEDLKNLYEQFKESGAPVCVVTCELEDPGMFGRIVRHQGSVKAIVEAKDATHESRKIKEVNTGIYMIEAEILNNLLGEIRPHNAQGEFYFTDIVGLAVEEGIPVQALPTSSRLAMGVNTQAELAAATRSAYKRKAKRLMEDGVIVMNPNQCFVEDIVEVGPGTILYPNIFLRGTTKVAAYCVIEPQTMISNSVIGEGVHIKAGCYIDDSKIAEKAELGPYAHLRPGTDIGEECKVGNFVEMKKVKFGKGSKASHLTYLGDAEIGTDTNIGCGTITCNYAVDRKKYVTKIGNNVFVGSDSQFVAPVTIGDNAIIGSGSTITKDVPAGALGVARAKQFVKENYMPKPPGEKKDK
jgi:bifunctional UDP-N-acetylglucosamine pyrophosphorylase/glucosamine-1-phosphate N-acetyltransferase